MPNIGYTPLTLCKPKIANQQVSLLRETKIDACLSKVDAICLKLLSVGVSKIGAGLVSRSFHKVEYLKLIVVLQVRRERIRLVLSGG